MTDFAHIKRCFDVTNDDILAAVESREQTLELLRHLASVSQPDTGAPKVVLVFAMMATNACEWLDGALRVDMKASGDATTIDVTSELGGGMLERVFPTLRFDVEIGELSRTISRAEKRIAPLRVLSSKGGRIVLGASEAERRSTMPPQGVRIADEHIFHSKSLRAARVPAVDTTPVNLPVVEMMPLNLPVVGPKSIAPVHGESKSMRPKPAGAKSVGPKAAASKSIRPKSVGPKSPSAAPKRKKSTTPPNAESTVDDLDSGWDDD